MSQTHPKAISKSAAVARQKRVAQIARDQGFVGSVEYRHVYSQAGGAQYGLAPSPKLDLLIVYAEAFERDLDPDDFSLEAILAHERGHQLLARHERLNRNLPGDWSDVSEEIAASLLGSLVAKDEKDQQDLVFKALFDATVQGLERESAAAMIADLRALLEQLL